MLVYREMWKPTYVVPWTIWNVDKVTGEVTSEKVFEPSAVAENRRRLIKRIRALNATSKNNVVLNVNGSTQELARRMSWEIKQRIQRKNRATAYNVVFDAQGVFEYPAQTYNIELSKKMPNEYPAQVRMERGKEYLGVVVKSENDVQRVVEKHLDQLVASRRIHYLRGWENLDLTITPMKKTEAVKTENLRMFRVGAPRFPSMKMPDFEKEPDRCVRDFLMYQYNNPEEKDRFKKIASLTEDRLKEVLLGSREASWDMGVSTLDVLRFCETYGIPMRAYDHEMNEFSRYEPEKRNKKVPALYFVCANSHMYPIVDEAKRKSLRERERSVQSEATFTKEKTKDTEKKEHLLDLDVEELEAHLGSNKAVYYQQVSLEKIVLELVDKGFTFLPGEVKSDGSNINYVQLPGLTLYANQHYETVKKDVTTLGQVMINQSPTGVVYKHFMDTCPTPKHRYSPHVWELLLSPLFHRTSFTLDVFSQIQDVNNVQSNDITKCFTSVLYDRPDGWGVLSAFDEIKPFSGVLRPGWFHVETDNYFPFQRTGFYSYEMVKEGLEDGIITKEQIKYELIPERVLARNHFKVFVDDVYGNLCEPKFSINCLVGVWARHCMTTEKHTFTTDHGIATYQFFHDQKVVVRKLSGEERTLFNIVHTNKTKLMENFMMYRNDVLDLANLATYRLRKAMGGKLICVKTDNVIVEGGVSVATGEKRFGAYHEVPVDAEKLVEQVAKGGVREVVPVPPVKNNKYWYKVEYTQDFEALAEEVLELEGCFVTGEGGTGKTHLLKIILRKLQEQEKRVAVVAPTNKASLNIGGVTLNTFLGVDADDAQMKKSHYERFDYVLVDEESMVSGDMWYRLNVIKRKHPKIRFIVAGDHKQLPPVEPNQKVRTYHKSDVVRYLVAHNRLVLEKNFRADAELLALSQRQRKGEDVRSAFGDTVHWTEYVMWLCYTNMMRVYLNRCSANQHNEGKQTVRVPQTCWEEYGDSDDWELCAGAPLIARHNNKEERVAKNDSYTLAGWNDGVAVCESVREIDGQKVSVEVKIDELSERFEPAYAITIHKSQGDTIEKPYNIAEWQKLTNAQRYVAVSRGTRKENVHIVDVPYKAEALKGIIYHLVSESGKLYVGSTMTSLATRWARHQRDSQNVCLKSKLYRAMRDGEVFNAKQIWAGSVGSKAELLRLEREEIMRQDSIEGGLNENLPIKN